MNTIRFIDMAVLITAFALAINAIFDGNWLLASAQTVIVICSYRLLNNLDLIENLREIIRMERNDATRT